MSMDRQEYYERKRARIAEIDEKALNKARQDVHTLTKQIERALHKACWHNQLGVGCITSVVFSGGRSEAALISLENTAGWKCRFSVGPRYVYRSFSRRPTGQAEAEVGGDSFSHKGPAVILRKDGTADVDRLIYQATVGWQEWEARTRALRQERSNEAAVERIRAKFPNANVRASSYPDTVVRLSLPQFVTEENAVKILSFLDREGIK